MSLHNSFLVQLGLVADRRTDRDGHGGGLQRTVTALT